MNYNKLLNNLKKLKLDKMYNYLPQYLDEINKQQIPFVDTLYTLTEKEIDFKDEKTSANNILGAHFPFNKTLDDFDFDFQPSINRTEIFDLATLRFLTEKKNVVFVGTSGVGKTHLSVALGVEAAKKRFSTYFITCHELIDKLSLANKENKFSKTLKKFCRYDLLIIDEVWLFACR